MIILLLLTHKWLLPTHIWLLPTHINNPNIYIYKKLLKEFIYMVPCVIIWWCHMSTSSGAMCRHLVVPYVKLLKKNYIHGAMCHHLVVPCVDVWWCHLSASCCAICQHLVLPHVSILLCHCQHLMAPCVSILKITKYLPHQTPCPLSHHIKWHHPSHHD